MVSLHKDTLQIYAIYLYIKIYIFNFVLAIHIQNYDGQ